MLRDKEMTYEKMQQVNEAILDDMFIKDLIEQKQKIMNHATPKYLVDKKTNTATAILDNDIIEMLEKIDLLVEFRTEQIKKHFA